MVDYIKFIAKRKKPGALSRSLIPIGKISSMLQLLNDVTSIEGDVAECGVYRGGSAYFICEFLESVESNKRIHLFDTFTGIPYSSLDKSDSHKVGDFSTVDLTDVKSHLQDHNDKIDYHAGEFPSTFNNLDISKKFSFIHVDCDVYDSVLSCCEFFYDRMNSGGIILFDDTNSPSCRGALRALNDFVKHAGIEYLRINNDNHYIVKE